MLLTWVSSSNVAENEETYIWNTTQMSIFNALRPEQDDRHLAHESLTFILVYENVTNLIGIPFRYVAYITWTTDDHTQRRH